MKRLISLVLVLGIALGISGCGKKDSQLTGDSLELTIHMFATNIWKFNNDWSVFKKAAELTGVTLKGTVANSASEPAQAFNTMIASGSLPDIIHYKHPELQQYGMEGALIPLNDLIEDHAPNFKKFLDENPDVKKHITAEDGNIYDISFIADGKAAQGYFIRQDWLDKLGLSVPTTIDGVYNTLKAFSERDPNGNGKKDEIPFFQRTKELMYLSEWFGGNAGFYEAGKQVKYGPTEEAYFDTILTLAKWYSEGLIDQEIFTRDNARDVLLGNDTSGMTHDWFVSTASYNDILKDKIEGFNFVPMLPPADVNGVVKTSSVRQTFGTWAWGISHSNKHPGRTMKYFDFWFSDEGRMLANFGIEGQHYTIENGKPVFVDAILKGNDPVLTALNKEGIQLEFGFHQDYEYELSFMDPIARQGVDMYENITPDRPFPSLQFSEDEKKVLTAKLTPIDTYIKETMQSIILRGNTDSMTYDKYKATIDGMGLSDVLKVYNDAYSRYMMK